MKRKIKVYLDYAYFPYDKEIVLFNSKQLISGLEYKSVEVELPILKRWLKAQRRWRQSQTEMSRLFKDATYEIAK